MPDFRWAAWDLRMPAEWTVLNTCAHGYRVAVVPRLHDGFPLGFLLELSWPSAGYGAGILQDSVPSEFASTQDSLALSKFGAGLKDVHSQR